MSSSAVRVPFRKKVYSQGRPVYSVQLTLRLENPLLPGVGSYATSIVDSGATFTVFHARYARDLGLDLRGGEALTVTGIGGSRLVWLHQIRLYLPGGSVLIKAGFQEDLPAAGLLGMSGFFEHFRITFDGAAQTCEFERVTPQKP